MKVNILGADYSISFYEELEARDGSCNFSTKEIKVCKTILDKCIKGDAGFEIEFLMSVLRHEIIHAFHGESGFDNFGNITTEGIVDWIAIQFHKIESVIFSAELQVKEKYFKDGK